MKHTQILITIAVALMLFSCMRAKQDIRETDATNQKAEANALLGKIRDVLPEGWEATLYWDPEDIKKGPFQHPVDWLDDSWSRWLPGMDGRRIEIRRNKAVHYQVDGPGPNPYFASYVRNEKEYLRFAMTLGNAREQEDINKRLIELNNMIKELEVVLKPSFNHQREDGYIRHSVPGDDKGRQALQEYEKLWAIKRWFPQWAEGGISIGFRSLIWLRMLPEEAKVEYRQAKEKVLNILHPIQGWKYISADEE
jgi:hypothetical protein